MADAFPITTIVLPESPADLQPTAVMGGFSQLLIALATLVEAERDLEHFDIWDLATDHWLREAEEAFTQVTTLVHRIRNAAPARLEDRKLQRVTTLLDTMIGSEEPGTFQRFHSRLHRFDWLFSHHGGSPLARRVAELLNVARRRIDELAELPCFIDTPMADEVEPAPEMPGIPAMPVAA